VIRHGLRNRRILYPVQYSNPGYPVFRLNITVTNHAGSPRSRSQQYYLAQVTNGNWDSVVVIVTIGLNGSGFEPREEQEMLSPTKQSYLALRPTQPISSLCAPDDYNRECYR
jgi:hypothetical protein